MAGKERCLNEEQILQYQEAFMQFETSKKGLVSTKAVGDLLRQTGLNPTYDELQV